MILYFKMMDLDLILAINLILIFRFRILEEHLIFNIKRLLIKIMRKEDIYDL